MNVFIWVCVEGNSIFFFFLKIVIFVREFCLILLGIVGVVKKCLNNEMEWKKVVVRKNCVVYVRLCSNFM